MKASELKSMLESLPDDVEIVVGDRDCGQFWDPVISKERAFTAWKVTEKWPERHLHYVNFFAIFNHAQHQAKQSAHQVIGPVECRVLCL